jgi:hypothetical protein
MALNIKIEKRDLWLVSAIVVFLVGTAYVIAIGSNNYQVQGHDFSELQKCASGKVLKSDASGNWVCGDDNTGAGGSGDITDVNGGNGLTPDTCSSGSCSLSVNTGTASTTGLEIVSDQVRMIDDGCSSGEVLKRNSANTGWVCEPLVKNSFVVCATTLSSTGCNCAGSTQIEKETVYGTCTKTSDSGRSCSSTGCKDCFPNAYQGTCCVCRP